jgi:hypothetical protein
MGFELMVEGQEHFWVKTGSECGTPLCPQMLLRMHVESGDWKGDTCGVCDEVVSPPGPDPIWV